MRLEAWQHLPAPPPPESKICLFCRSANSPPLSTEYMVTRSVTVFCPLKVWHRCQVDALFQTSPPGGSTVSPYLTFISSTVSKGAKIARRGVHHSAFVMKTLGEKTIRDCDSALRICSAAFRGGVTFLLSHPLL